MAGLNHLKEVYDKKGEDFLNNLLNNYVIINELVNGTFFGVKKNKNDQFKYFKKAGEITYVDRVLMKYYEPAIRYFESMPLEKRQRIPSNFYFGFEYFTNGDSFSNKYDSLPKNNLVLSYIHKLDDSGQIVSTVQHKEQLDKWADYLGVERPPIIFEGHLNDEQKTAILDFVYAPTEELFKKFKTTSFSKYILSSLEADSEKSFLRSGPAANMDTIVFRFYDETQENPEASVFLAKLVDPLFVKNGEAAPKENKTQDYIWLIVIDLMNHFEVYDVSDLKGAIDGPGEFDEKYVKLINKIFKDFIEEYKEKYEGLELEIPEYLKRPEFELDKNLVRDPQAIKIIESNETYREIYKILLNFFRRVRKKSNASFFTPNLLTQLNLIVNKIKNIIMGDEIYESLFPSFSEFVDSPSAEVMLSEKEFSEKNLSKEEPTPVNILIGNFQPVTMGHIKAAQKMKEKNGNKTYLVGIKNNKRTQVSPFSLEETRVMLERVQQEYSDLIADVKLVESGKIEEILEALYPTYEPELWGTSERRLKDYLLQLDYVKKKKIPLRISDKFKLVELPAYVKSEEVLKTLEDSDFLKFKKMVPSCIAPHFFNLQKELLSVNESLEITTSIEPIEEEDPRLKEEDIEKEED
jgi:Cytidylyltransferase-like